MREWHESATLATSRRSSRPKDWLWCHSPFLITSPPSLISSSSRQSRSMVTLYATWPLGSRLAQMLPRMLRIFTTRTGRSLLGAASGSPLPLLWYGVAMVGCRLWGLESSRNGLGNCLGVVGSGPLSGLMALTELYLWDTEVTDLSPVTRPGLTIYR